MEKYRKNWKVIIAFLLPAFVIYVFLAVIPIAQSIYFAFFNWAGIQGVALKYVGFSNFEEIFSMSDFYKAFYNAFKFALLNLTIQIPLGYFLAYILSSYCKGYKVFKTIFFSSVILPITATSLLFKFIFGPNKQGILNALLLGLGLGDGHIGWLIQPSTALLCVIFANAWCGFGYHMTIGFAAISGIPKDIFDACEIDGATGLKRIFHIVLPMIWESLKISIVLIITGSIKVFDIIFVMTEGGPNGMTQVPAVMLYNEAFKYNNYGISSALSVVIFAVSLGLAGISMKLMNKNSGIA